MNTFFVELEKRATVCETVDMARKLGVKYADGADLGEVRTGGTTAEVASFTLGSTEISPLTLANAYATVSAAMAGRSRRMSRTVRSASS